jgi:putative transposase
MSPVAASKRDFDELEKRRMRAAKLLGRGVSQAEVARQVKASRQSVRRWALQILEHGGADGLKKAGRAGRRPRLSAPELERLESILREGPEKAGFPNGLWTLDRIARIIKGQFGVKYHTAQVWRILRQKLGWSCQRPIGRARERNEAAIRDWKENIWPALKKKPRTRAGSSSS